MINNKEQMMMWYPQQPINRRRAWRFDLGIKCHKLAISCWDCCESYSSTYIKQNSGDIPIIQKLLKRIKYDMCISIISIYFYVIVKYTYMI